MSKLIEGFNHQSKPYFKINFHASQKRSLEFINKENLNIKGKNFIITKQSNSYIKANAFIPSYYQQKELSVTMIVDQNSKSLKILLFLNSNNFPVSLRSRCLNNQTMKTIARVNSKKPFWQPDLLLGVGTGVIYFKMDLYFTQQTFLSPQNVLLYGTKLLSNSIHKINFLFAKFLNLLNLCSQNTYKNFNLNQIDYKIILENDQRLNYILKNIEMSALQKQISIKISMIGQQQINKVQIQYEILNNKRQEQKIFDSLNQCIKDQLRLFSKSYAPKFTMLNYQIDSKDAQIFHCLLKKPFAKSGSKQGENKQIFNLIKVHQPSQIKAKKFREGGNSILKIFLSSFTYQQIIQDKKDSFINQLMDATGNFKFQNKLLDKVLCAKIPKDRASHSKIEHEKNIIMQIRNQSSAYLFKYYLSDQKDFLFYNNLLIDATKYPNLNDYIGQNKRVLSIRTKIFILSQIAQALSFLKDSKIAHMDLKKSNIMVMKELQIKIFDFTQSYHYNVCDQHYNPGITMPYAPPEVFQKNRKIFDYSQDMFSFGILCYNLIFDQDPFQVSPKLYEAYQNKTYMKHWFICQQIGEQICYNKLFIILLNFIYRCLSPNPNQRPTPSWSVIILKQIFAYVTNP